MRKTKKNIEGPVSPMKKGVGIGKLGGRRTKYIYKKRKSISSQGDRVEFD